MEQSAVSHHLKVLRDLGLLTARRDGRFVYYALHDHHLPDLLAAMRHHYEHVATAVHDAVSDADSAASFARR